jgi:hypothetical protein
MIMFLLPLSVASSIGDFDAANLAFTQCLFATSRAANEARLSLSAFEERLATVCHREQSVLEALTAKDLAAKGDPSAAASARQLSAEARRQVVESYRQLLEMRPELERIAAMCNAHPDQCRD